MKITKLDVQQVFEGDDFVKNRFTIVIVWRNNRHKKDRIYTHTVPLDVFHDIGPKETAKRIYPVFKQHISRKQK
ncbi:MAG TPA: hypothetical protein VHA52_04550 [Candidatus Babeliaceae bacterium]|nr:hypothetical protein [Candidatus Babeliaceae bacterium]